MPRKTRLLDYESLTRPRSSRSSEVIADEWDSESPKRVAAILPETKQFNKVGAPSLSSRQKATPVKSDANGPASQGLLKNDVLRRGHALTYGALFVFTVILYARPAEFYPSPVTASIALIVGLLTIVVYFPTQLALESTLTARPREVNLILLFCLTGLLSIPLAVNPAQAWSQFSGTFIRCIVIFIVMVNAVRTARRLQWLLLLAVAVSCWLSVGALNDYRLGHLAVEGYRVAGVGEGIFGNSNDMAFHLVTILPITIALIFAGRSVVRKVLFAICVALMVGAIVVTYSRGAFLGGLVALVFLGWQLGRNNRVTIYVLGAIVLLLLLLVAPGNYSIRLLSIFVPSLDPVGSSSARQGELYRSIYVAIRHPLFGVGMGNYASEMSYSGLVTHNAYTQVAAEMGTAALVIYTMFVVSPLKKLGQIARETLSDRASSHYYYLAVGLQASLLAYLVSSFFASVAYLWYVYYLVGYAVCLRRMYESETGRIIVLGKARYRKPETLRVASIGAGEARTTT